MVGARSYRIPQGTPAAWIGIAMHNFPTLAANAPQAGDDSPPEIESTNVRIYYLSRSWPCLLLLLAGLLATGTFLARMLSNPHPAGSGREAADVLQELLHDRRPDLCAAVGCVLRLPAVTPDMERE